MAALNPQQARELVDRARPQLQKQGVVSVGFGRKRQGGQWLDTQAIIVYVNKKLPLSALSSETAVPKDVEGVPTDVVEIKTVSALNFIFLPAHSNRKRPCPGGYSIGHTLITAGTMGLPVVMKDGAKALLSNTHVLAPHWAGEVKKGQPILQPGPYDGGKPEDAIAYLHSWSTLDFTGQPNQVDAALALMVQDGLVDWRIEGLPAVYEKAGEPHPGVAVQKVGRTTGHTTGTIAVVGAAVRVSYGDKVALFTDQLEIVAEDTHPPFSAGGDSGSAILTEDGKQVLGLLFAGDDTTTYANPIAQVQAALGFEIVPAPVPETIETQLAGLRGNLLRVWGFDAPTQTWTVYDPTQPSALNTLKVMEGNKGYWINMGADISFGNNGFTWQLRKGWNLIGWQG